MVLGLAVRLSQREREEEEEEERRGGWEGGRRCNEILLCKLPGELHLHNLDLSRRGVWCRVVLRSQQQVFSILSFDHLCHAHFSSFNLHNKGE